MSDFTAHRTVKARKSHGCEECGRTIEPGEKAAKRLQQGAFNLGI